MGLIEIRKRFEDEFPGAVIQVASTPDGAGVAEISAFSLPYSDRHRFASTFVQLVKTGGYPGLTHATEIMFFTPEESQEHVFPELLAAELSQQPWQETGGSGRWRTAKAEVILGETSSAEPPRTSQSARYEAGSLTMPFHVENKKEERWVG